MVQSGDNSFSVEIERQEEKLLPPSTHLAIRVIGELQPLPRMVLIAGEYK